MVKVASLFSQVLHHFPRTQFESLVKKHNAESHCKGFACWSQFVAMIFSQLAHADSLREICNGLRCCLGKLIHLGLTRAPNKSTLAYANEHRPAALYEALFYSVYALFIQHGGFGRRKTKFRFKNKLLSLSTQPPSPFAFPSFHGPGSGAPKAASKFTPFSITTTICHPSSTSPRQENMTSRSPT